MEVSQSAEKTDNLIKEVFGSSFKDQKQRIINEEQQNEEPLDMNSLSKITEEMGLVLNDNSETSIRQKQSQEDIADDPKQKMKWEKFLDKQNEMVASRDAKQAPENEELLMDFSSSFKQTTRAGKAMKKKAAANKKKKSNSKSLPRDGTDDVNKDLEDSNFLQNDANTIITDPQQLQAMIPRNLQITQENMAMRKVMDIRRWFCMGRPQYPKSCGISSLVSCWNYLFSTLGVGQKNPISTEEALEVLGFQPPYRGVSFGSFTGNDTLVQWWGLLNRKFGVRGEAQVMYKMHGNNITHGTYKEKALDKLMTGLQSDDTAYIYHCYNHYMCPIGFERTPVQPIDAYALTEQISEFDTWIIIGEISKCYPSFHIKKWQDIVTDIECEFPKFFNIRKSEMGIQEKASPAFIEGKHKGGNLHCIIEFKSLKTVKKAPKVEEQKESEQIQINGHSQESTTQDNTIGASSNQTGSVEASQKSSLVDNLEKI